MDVELAIVEVRAFRDDVNSYDNAESPFPVGDPYETPIDRTAELRSQISNRLPIVEAIARESNLAEQDRLRDWRYVGRASNAIAAADELLGILGGKERLDTILGAQGPKLAASRMHPWVWEAAARLWDSGNRRAAVQQAAAAVFDGYFPACARFPRKQGVSLPYSLGRRRRARGWRSGRAPGIRHCGSRWPAGNEGACSRLSRYCHRRSPWPPRRSLPPECARS
jgi:hypothetical protein